MSYKMKILVLTCILVLALPISAYSVTAEIDGKVLDLDPSPIVENGTTLVPMRQIFEALGAIVEYDHETKTIVAYKGSHGIALMIDYPSARVLDLGSQNKELLVPPKVINGVTFVPLRFVGEALDAEVTWNGDTQTISIKTKPDEGWRLASDYIDTLKRDIIRDAEHRVIIGATIYANTNYSGWLTIDGPPANVKNLEPMEICNIWYQEYIYSASYGVKLKRADETYITLGDTSLDPLPTIAHLGNYFHLVNPYEKYPNWPESVWNKIKEQKVSIGMTKEQVLLSWGKPDDINKTILTNLMSEQWVYGDPLYGAQYVYFDNDVVTALQE